METPRTGRLIAAVAFALFLALRLPWALGWEPAGEEPLCVGMGRYVVVERDWRAEPLVRHPPLAFHVGGIGLWALRTPVEPWDAEAPPTQVGWMALAESRLGEDGPPLAPGLVAILARLPGLLLGLAGIELIRRMGQRIHGPCCGGLAAAAWALHPGLAVHGALAATEGVAASLAVVLLAATADVGTNPIAEGAEVRRRVRTLGVAAALAALASHALWPLLLVSVAWLATRNAARRRRGDHVRRGGRGNVVTVAMIALLVGWAGYAFELRPAVGADGGHPLTNALAAAGGLEPGALDAIAASAWLPAASWFRSVGHTLFLEPRAAPLETLATLGAAVPWGVWALGAAGLLGLVHFLRDRANVPSLLFYATFAPLAGALVLPPRLTVACALVAAPGAVLLGASAIARLGARKRVASVVVGVAVVALFALQWAVGGPPRELALVPGGGAPAATLSAEERWQIERLAAGRGLDELHIVAGRPRGLAARGEHLIRDHEPGDEALTRVLERVADEETGGALIVGDWLLDDPALAPLTDATPAARVGRLVVFGLR